MSKHKRKYYFPGSKPLWQSKLMEWFQSYEPVPDFPEDIQIQTVTGCNASCVFCPSGKTKKSVPPARMDDALYGKIIDECLQHPVKRISPYLMNEPLLDRKLGSRISYLADRKPKSLSVKINTNASLLRGDMVDQILDSGLDRLNISFHGISKHVYEESMQGLNFEEVLANVNKFLETKKKRGSKKPKVTMVMIKTKLIEQEIDAVRDYWRKKNVGTHIRAMENRANMTIQGKNINPDKWHPFLWCKRLFTQGYILANGDMVLCCVDWERTTILGNVRQKGIKEIWNGDKAVSIREKFLRGNTMGLLCHTCLKQL